jgi:hypothetical protein
MGGDDEEVTALDKHVAPGLRLWMLIALISGVLLIMGSHLHRLTMRCNSVCSCARLLLHENSHPADEARDRAHVGETATAQTARQPPRPRRFRSRSPLMWRVYQWRFAGDLRGQTIVMHSLNVPGGQLMPPTSSEAECTEDAESTEDEKSALSATPSGTQDRVCKDTAVWHIFLIFSI